MTLQNTNFGSEYGIEIRLAYSNWSPAHKPGEGFETYEEVYQKALVLLKDLCKITTLTGFKVVVYDYDSSKRKNIRLILDMSIG